MWHILTAGLCSGGTGASREIPRPAPGPPGPCTAPYPKEIRDRSGQCPLLPVVSRPGGGHKALWISQNQTTFNIQHEKVPRVGA